MKSKRKIIMPTVAEDAEINRGIALDPDTYEVPSEDFKKMRRLGARSKPQHDGEKAQTDRTRGSR
jgi:hypothetical protein